MGGSVTTAKSSGPWIQPTAAPVAPLPDSTVARGPMLRAMEILENATMEGGPTVAGLARLPSYHHCYTFIDFVTKKCVCLKNRDIVFSPDGLGDNYNLTITKHGME